jgi:hypothetical protein
MPSRTHASRWLGLVLAMAGALATSGCKSAPRLPGPNAIPPPILPGPPPNPPGPAGLTIPPTSEAIYRNPKIGLVYLRAHQDADGRLLGPQVMYQVIEPGGWNVAAVEQGGGYIPAMNLEVPLSQGSPSAAPARTIQPLADSNPLLDPAAAAEITITGLMRLADQPEAEGLARREGVGVRAEYDAQAGWLLLPPNRKP